MFCRNLLLIDFPPFFLIIVILVVLFFGLRVVDSFASFFIHLS